ncbi:MAG: hypothetical protein HY395_01460 [Candidatus Doudnabacteria bacterium]|nr:hypothetical protein [Candidatus Doudnabacteria bacterium]
MAKYPKRLTKKEQETLFIEFVQALTTLRSPEEMAHFIQDLLSKQEVFMLARRLQIARLLYQGLTYDEIKKSLNAGLTTIAKVQTWMQLYGEGYRTVLERTKKKQTERKGLKSWKNFQRRYPAYFWPQLLLEELVKSANAKQKKRILEILDKVKEKTALSKELDQFIKASDL